MGLPPSPVRSLPVDDGGPNQPEEILVDAHWWSAWAPKLTAYSLLIRLLIDERISGKEFEALFLQLYQDDPTDWPVHVLDVLEGLFADVDELGVGHSGLAANPGRAESELRQRANAAFGRLAELTPALP
jgi:hypothetical protein